MENPLRELTEGEQQVLLGILAGLANKNMARSMGCSLRTVETRRASLFQKTGTESVPELVLLVVWHLYGVEYNTGDLEGMFANRLEPALAG